MTALSVGDVKTIWNPLLPPNDEEVVAAVVISADQVIRNNPLAAAVNKVVEVSAAVRFVRSTVATTCAPVPPPPPLPLDAEVTSPLALTVMLALVKEPTLELTVAKVKEFEPVVLASPEISDAEKLEPLPRTRPVSATELDKTELLEK